MSRRRSIRSVNSSVSASLTGRQTSSDSSKSAIAAGLTRALVEGTARPPLARFRTPQVKFQGWVGRPLSLALRTELSRKRESDDRTVVETHTFLARSFKRRACHRLEMRPISIQDKSEVSRPCEREGPAGKPPLGLHRMLAALRRSYSLYAR